MVIVDTPGLLNPRYALQEAMRGAALHALEDADVIVYLHDVTEGPAPTLESAAELEHPPKAPVLLALNKIDALPAEPRIPGPHNRENAAAATAARAAKAIAAPVVKAATTAAKGGHVPSVRAAVKAKAQPPSSLPRS